MRLTVEQEMKAAVMVERALRTGDMPAFVEEFEEPLPVDPHELVRVHRARERMKRRRKEMAVRRAFWGMVVSWCMVGCLACLLIYWAAVTFGALFSRGH